MNKSYITNILHRYLSHRFPASTEEKVQKWIVRDENAEEKEHSSFLYWNELETDADSGTYSALQRVNKRINYPTKQQKTIRFRRKMLRITAIFISCMVMAGGYLYYTQNTESLIEIFVAYGENKHIVLPDSSQVWLNAGTKIKYPRTFKGDRRTIFLDGEAYFSVTRNESRPFNVQTGEVSVTVLGTCFNIKAYSGDPRIITTLTSGTVEVNTPGNIPHILKPNEQLTYDTRTMDISLSEIPPGETNGWLSGQLIFSNSSLSDILMTLERRFNISFSNQISPPISGQYTIKFLKDESLDEILPVLENVMDISFSKQVDCITVMKK